MQHRRSAGLAAGLTCLGLLAGAPAAVAAGPANVTVRVEGAQATLVEETRLHTTLQPVDKSGATGETCTGTSGAGALEQVTAGDWTGSYFGPGFGYSVERIFQETYRFDANGDYWTVWINDRASQTGLCTELQEGDEVLLYVDRCVFDQQAQRCTNEPVLPLELRAPATGRTDAAAEVTVVRYDAQGAAAPVAGVQVSGPGVAATTGTDGKAAVRFGQSGPVRLKAQKAGFARSAGADVCVAAGADGTCGTTAPGAPPATATTPVRDTTAPLTRIAGIREQQRFRRSRGPRALRGSVTPDPSGLRAVKLSLTRSRGGRCAYYSPTRERFRANRCGRRAYFPIGDRQDWEYLLPSRLRRGRYVFDAVAIDKAGNRDRLVRGRSRVVFHVR